MILIINGKKEAYEKDSITIAELLELKKVKMPEMVTVELNGTILERDKFKSTYVKDNDTIELIYYMGGGSLLN